MILTKIIKIKVNNKNIKYYKNKGYNIKYGEITEIDIDDVLKGSQKRIDVKCDICGKESNISIQKYYNNYNKYNIYTCLKCSRTHKNNRTNIERYGTETPMLIDTNPELYKKKQKLKIRIRKISRLLLKINGGKICYKCNNFKTLDRYTKSNRRTDGYINKCKDCTNERKREIYIENYDELLIKNRISRNRYVENNRAKVNKQQREYYHNTFKFTNKHQFIWRQILATAMRRLGKKKEDKTINLLGYSALELKEYIENNFLPQMNWDNYGTEWHIDHIIPVSIFDNDTDVSIVCALNNLQPLWATTREIDGIIYEGNLNKGSKFN